jgi:hypothetical protein
MKKAFLWILPFFVLMLGSASALEILLTSPVPQTAPNKVRVSDISDHPDRKQLSFRLSIGYTDTNGSWVEVSDYHELISNTPAILDDPNTSMNEAKPAQPRYDNLQTVISTSGKTAEEIILNRAKAKFPGKVQ